MSTLKSRSEGPHRGLKSIGGSTLGGKISEPDKLADLAQSDQETTVRHPYPHDLGRAQIENQLATVGVLDPTWAEKLLEESITRIDSKLKSGVSPEERAELLTRKNGLLNHQFALIGERVVYGAESPVPSFGQHPACSRPIYSGIAADADTRGAGD